MDEYLNWLNEKIKECDELLTAQRDNYEWQHEGLLDYWQTIIGTYKECKTEYIKGLQS